MTKNKNQIRYDIANYGELKAFLKENFKDLASYQERYGYALQRWIVKDPSNENSVSVQIDLNKKNISANNDLSNIVQINLFGKQRYDRINYRGFPYNQIPRYPPIANSNICLIPVAIELHGCADNIGKYSLHFSPESAKIITFAKRLIGKSIAGSGWSNEGYIFNSKDLKASINAILVAQNIMDKINPVLEIEANKIFDKALA